MKIKVVSIVGARPQFIKLAPVSRALRAVAEVSEIIVHTGQHYDEQMSQVFFDELQIPRPDFNLGIGSGSHGAQTGRMLEALEQVLISERPQWTLVFGDTNSTLAGALAAAKLHLPLVHVEAGLRSFNRAMPEEINRVVADQLANLLLVPTPTAQANLLREGVDASRIRQVGDVMYDAVKFYRQAAEERSAILREIKLLPQKYVLCTIHRAENTDDAQRLTSILRGLAHVAERIPVVFPVHPRTRQAIDQMHLNGGSQPALHFIRPVGYLDMVALEAAAGVIATDSGGVQKEAFFHGVPCVTLRNETEWVELVEAGWNRLTPPTSGEVVANAVLSAIDSRGKPMNVYGEGTAAQLIVQALLETKHECISC